MLAIIGGLGAAIAWATTTLVAARATRLIDVRSLLATVMAVGLVVSAPAATISGIPHGVAGSTWAWLALSGLANVAGLLCSYSALRVGKVGIVAPITSTEGAVAAVIAVVAGESLSAGTGVTLAVVAVGVMLAARARSADDESRRTNLRAALFAGGAALAFGFGLSAAGLLPRLEYDVVSNLPGGYPELHAALLATSTRSAATIRAHAAAGKPLVAECGGMLYLLDQLTDTHGTTTPMLGLLPGHATMQPRFTSLGMQQIDGLHGPMTGHTFHYSKLTTPLTPLSLPKPESVAPSRCPAAPPFTHARVPST